MRAENFRAMAEKLFVGGGELGALLRSHDWLQTPLGAVETWSDDLKMAVQILLTELDQTKSFGETQPNAQDLQDNSAVLQAANQLNAFRVKLAEALRPLTDALEIQESAARILGESLGASRVIYIEVVSAGEEVVVHGNYTNGVAQLSGRYRIEDYRRNLAVDHRAGHTQVVTDIPNDPKYTDAQKTRYREIDIAAHIDVPLIKNKQFVALLAVQQSTPRQWMETEVRLVEETAEQTWAAAERALAETALRESEAKYRTLFESIDEGFCIVEMLLNENDTPVDYRFLEINPVFEQQTGLQQAVGKTARQLLPDLEDFWIKTYGRVALTGEPIRFENYSASMNRWFDVYACRTGKPEDRKVAIIFKDINDRKRIEDDRKQAKLNADFLVKVTQKLIEATCADEIVQTVGEQLNRYLKTSRCAFIEINESADEAVIQQEWHQEDLPSLMGVYRLPEFLTDGFFQTARTGKTIVVQDVSKDARIADQQRFASIKIGSFINVPLIRDGEWKFTLGVYHQEPYPWRSDEIELMCDLANRIWTMLSRARAEAALQKSEQQFRLMADAVPQIVWITDTEGRVEFFNKQWSNYTGASYEPTTAAEVAASFVHPEDGERTIEAFNAARRSGNIFSVEHRVRSFSGTYRWFLVRAEPYLDPQTGEIIRWFGASIDIHERKQVEDALRQSEARFRRIFECEMVPMGIYTPAGGIVEANNSLLNLIGYTRQELETGQISWQALTPPEYLALDEIAVNEVATRGVSTPYEKVYIHKDSRRIPILIGAALLKEDASSGVFFAIDLSERKQAEAALQEQSQLMQLILTNIGDGLIMANRQGEFVLFNQAAERMFGRLTNKRSPEEWSRTYGLYLPDGQTLFPDRQLPLYRAMQGEYATDVEVFVRRNPTDAGRWLGISGFPVRDGRGDITGGVITCRDVSERKRILQQEQAAREEAQRANRIKDEFLAVLSHELRSPLNPILGWTRLLQSGKLDAVRQLQALATIERNAKLQTQLIEDLLDISRIMQGKMSLTITPVSLTFVISAAVETVRLAAEAKNIQTVLDFPPYVALVNGDAARLQQVVWNLLTNAVKFTPHNGQVTVELRQLDQLAQIRVIDTGKGINPLFLPHVFEYFRQEDGSITRQFGGLGLGLAIARQIVELHGGRVWAESQGEGQGATFIVQLPAMRVAPMVSEPIQSKTDARLPLEGIQILLVDDEPDTREFQAFLLELQGADVTAVASGLEALQALEQSIPDVLVSDIGMAQMDGYMLIEQIRSRPLQHGGMIPAIALTAYAAEIDRTQALQVGFQTHITKPVEPEVLVREILLSLGRA